jgi:site-specific recombinase XerD
MSKQPIPVALFDTVEHLPFEADAPQVIKKLSAYNFDYDYAHAFLYAYRSNKATFNAYRREVERLLLWSWLIQSKSIVTLKRTDIETYLSFCQKPPINWIGNKKVPHYIEHNGKRIANSQWRPFVATVSKIAAKKGEKPNPKDYTLSEKALREVFAILSSFYNFLIQEGYTEVSPLLQVKQKSKYFRKRQSATKIRRLSELQWAYVLETAKQMAEEEPDLHERTLFIMTALYAMYLRISELVASTRWLPKMSDFYKDADNNWWFVTIGKGNKERQIAVSNAMLEALKRWRCYLNLSPLPSINEQVPLIPKHRGQGPIASTNQVRNIVQLCFDRAVAKMQQEGFTIEADSLQAATVHWLRHTGISDDVKRRPREHVRDDAGHSSSAITDKYIDIELRERHASAKNKPLEI